MNLKTKEIVLIAVAGLVVLAGAVALRYFQQPGITTPPVVTEEGAKPAGPADLGTAIFEQTANPVQGKVPEAVAPVQNPIQDIYKNPFQ